MLRRRLARHRSVDTKTTLWPQNSWHMHKWSNQIIWCKYQPKREREKLNKALHFLQSLASEQYKNHTKASIIMLTKNSLHAFTKYAMILTMCFGPPGIQNPRQLIPPTCIYIQTARICSEKVTTGSLRRLKNDEGRLEYWPEDTTKAQVYVGMVNSSSKRRWTIFTFCLWDHNPQEWHLLLSYTHTCNWSHSTTKCTG